MKDDVLDSVAFFSKYTIQDGERPDVIADKLYGSPDRDWIVVLTSGITNIKDEWPLVIMIYIATWKISMVN